MEICLQPQFSSPNFHQYSIHCIMFAWVMIVFRVYGSSLFLNYNYVLTPTSVDELILTHIKNIASAVYHMHIIQKISDLTNNLRNTRNEPYWGKYHFKLTNFFNFHLYQILKQKPQFEIVCTSPSKRSVHDASIDNRSISMCNCVSYIYKK